MTVEQETRSWVIPANEYQRQRWRNELGWTREIFRSPLHADDDRDWDWRLSIAEIERDADFSPFPGVERVLVLLAGNGLRLRFADGRCQELLPPHERARFSGEAAVRGELLDGPAHDVNLMWRRDRVVADLWHRPLVGPMVVFAEPGTTWAVFLIAGQAVFADDSGLPPLAAGDSAILQAGPRRLRHVLEGGGEALVMRIAPAKLARTGEIDLQVLTPPG
ncbi:MAG: HutD family protein [Pseudomonadota bacterium]|nr:HutD family protein [Pseudomonadota bacterium]